MKSELATQASTNFSIGQLEQQKISAQISAQLADAKYEALKTQSFLSDKITECCCSVKEKVDLVDRDRLRDALNDASVDNSNFKQSEYLGRFADPAFFGPGVGPWAGPYGGPYGGNWGGRGQNGPGNGNGDVNIYGGDYDRGHRRSRSRRSRSRSSSSDGSRRR